jgi:hypothetical protein
MAQNHIKSLTKTSVRTRVLIALGFIGAAAFVVAVTTGGGLRLDTGPTRGLNVTTMVRGGSGARSELTRWLNKEIAFRWGENSTILENNLKTVGCQWINNTASVFENCGTGSMKSSLSIELGSAPTVNVTSITSAGTGRYAIKFTTNYAGTGSNIRAKLKCVVRTAFGRIDGACPDASAKLVAPSMSFAESTAVLNLSTSNVDVEPPTIGRVTVNGDLELCFNIAVAGKTCFDIDDIIGSKLETQITNFVRKAVGSS